MIELVVKELRLGDVDDPEIYLGAAAYDWLQTDHGQWCKLHSTDLTYRQEPFVLSEGYYGTRYLIIAQFDKENALIYKLKWSNVK